MRSEAQRSLHLPYASNRIATRITMTTKAIIKSFKFSIKPSKAQIAKLNNTLDLCRFLYNSALQERIGAYKERHISLNYYTQANQLPDIKVSNPEYKDVHSQVLQHVLKRLDCAFQGFFRRIKAKQTAGFPRFKGKHRYNSFCYTQDGFSLSGNKLLISKIGKVKIRLSREMVGKVKTMTVKQESGKWFVIFVVETGVNPLPKTGQTVGIDMGISSFATLSDGTQIDNFKYYATTQKKLRVAQRRVSRRVKGSNCRRKAVLQLKKIHQKIFNQRNDFQHKVSTQLVKKFDVIAIERLSILGLSRGILAKQINDVAIGNFFQKLKYKAENAGKLVVEVPAAYTSQDCSRCGNRVKKDLSIRAHHCLQCGLILNRDFNAAINIHRLGLSLGSVKWNNSSCLLSESPPKPKRL